MILGGDNHPIVKYDVKEQKEISHSEFPMQPVGMALDASDRVWVHNFINHKLISFDSMLNNVKELDAPEQELFSSNSTLWSTTDRSKVYWYKGEQECLVLDGASGEVATEIDYLVDTCDVVSRISEAPDSKNLLVVTNSKSFDNGLLNRVVQQGADYKVTKKTKYAEATEGSPP